MKNVTYYVLLLVIGLSFSCKKDEKKATDKEIISFKIVGQIGDSKRDSVAATISVVMPAGTDLAAIKPSIIVSDKATITPASDVETNFANAVVEYTVTAEDGSTKKWIVTVVNAKRSDADILGFAIQNQSFPTKYTPDSVYVLMPAGTVLTALAPTIIISPEASITPSGTLAVDFSKGPIVYTITAADGTVKTWYVSVRIIRRDTKILSLIIPALNDTATVNESTVTVTVPYGTDLTKVVSTIAVSPGATISPASGTTVDYSKGGVRFTVTAEDKSYKKVYVVVVTPNVPVFKVADFPNNFNLVGRFVNVSTIPKTWASGSYISANFIGTYCDVILNDEVLKGNYYNYIEIIIDDTLIMRVKNTAKTNTIRVSSTLANKKHKITICKDTEAFIGYIEFVGLRCKAMDAPPVLPTHKIECIGNSITSGNGSDQSEFDCKSGGWYDKHNAYFSYGAITARSLNAQWHLSSASGIGLIHSCCIDTVDMPYVFDKTNLQLNGPSWDFSQYIPDVLTIGLGSNDGIIADADTSNFYGTFVSFIKTIRINYPNTQIILISSPMASGTLLANIIQNNAAVARRMKESGDSKVSTFVFSTSKSWNAGCGLHPSLVQHVEIANLLSKYIKSLMNW